ARASGPSLPALGALGALTLLLPHLLAAVADPFALVWLRFLDPPDLRGLLPYGFLVDPVDADVELARVRLLTHLEDDPFARLDLHRMAVTHRDAQILADQLGAITDTYDIERLRVAVRHAFDHVGDQRSRKAMERTVALLVARPLHAHLPVLDQHFHPL